MKDKKLRTFKHLACLSLITFHSAVYSLDITLAHLKNNKEVTSSSLSKEQWDKTIEKYSQKQTARLANIFYSSMEQIMARLEKPEHLFNLCEFEIINEFHKSLEKKQLLVNQESVESYLKALRVSHNIDDIFYDLLSAQSELLFGIKKNIARTRSARGKIQKKRSDTVYMVDVKPIYQGFTFDKNNLLCSFEQVSSLADRIKKNLPPRLKFSSMNFQKLNDKALREKIITPSTFFTLEYLRKNTKKRLPLVKQSRYFKIIFYSKDIKSDDISLLPEQLISENDFTSKKLGRFSKLSNRKKLYIKFNDEEIIDLSTVIQKASRRLGEDPNSSSSIPFISQTYYDENNQKQTEIYKLSPPEQFNYAKRRMAQDIVDLQNRKKSFVNVTIDAQDLITAALETGYIKHEDIQSVLSYENLWREEMSAWEKISSYAYSFSGVSAFYFPPPWNITGSLALATLNNYIHKKGKGRESDNPYVIIK